MKLTPLIIASSLLVGCQAVNKAKLSKPYGLSKLKTQKPHGPHFLEESGDPSQAEVSSTSVEMSELELRGLEALRERYGLPKVAHIKKADLEVMTKVYRHDLKALEARLGEK
jgi:hypothetical protein